MKTIFEGPVSFAEHVTLTRASREATRSRNGVLVLEATGHLDEAAYARAVLALGQRHEALRSSFIRDEDGTFRRRVHDLDIEPQFVDLSEEEHADLAARRWISEAVQEVRPLDAPPLCRTAVLRVGAQRQYLVFVLDHVLVDVFGGAIALKDLERLYSGVLRGASSDMAPAPQPRDVANLLEPVLAPVLADPEAHFPAWPDDAWTLEQDSDLPGDIVEGDTAAVFVPLPPWRTLFQMSRRHRVSPGCVLAAALAVGLRADAGRPDVSFAVVRKGRTPDTAGAMAFQIYTDLWKVHSGPDAGPLELLDEAAAFLRNEEPWRRAYVALRVPPTRRILFNLVGPHRDPSLPGLTCTMRFDMAPRPQLYAQHDLVFRVADLGPAVLGALGYRGRRFHEERIQRIADAIGGAMRTFAEAAP